MASDYAVTLIQQFLQGIDLTDIKGQLVILDKTGSLHGTSIGSLAAAPGCSLLVPLMASDVPEVQAV